MDNELHNRVANDRIAHRQIDELVGIARGLVADGVINQLEAKFLQKWLSANVHLGDQPLIATLFNRLSDMLSDSDLSADEKGELLDTLSNFSGGCGELGEALKSTTLPYCKPPPNPLTFTGKLYCFTGTFRYGLRKDCEAIVAKLGATSASLSMKTDYLVVGAYATDSWLHSSYGAKIEKAVAWKAGGKSISIVAESYWTTFLV